PRRPRHGPGGDLRIEELFASRTYVADGVSTSVADCAGRSAAFGPSGSGPDLERTRGRRHPRVPVRIPRRFSWRSCLHARLYHPGRRVSGPPTRPRPPSLLEGTY